jgi:hypothetical protein
MFGGVAVRDCYDITEGHLLKERIRTREGRPEMYFLLTDRERVLPVYLGGRTQVVRWGVQPGQSRLLPATTSVPVESLDMGRWNSLAPIDAVIRASRVLDNDIWFDVREGVHAIVFRDERHEPVVYPLLEPASHYYQVMTGSQWMPCLVRQRI